MLPQMSWTSRLSLPVWKFIEYPLGELTIIDMTVCDSGHRKVFVFRINQANL